MHRNLYRVIHHLCSFLPISTPLSTLIRMFYVGLKCHLFWKIRSTMQNKLVFQFSVRSRVEKSKQDDYWFVFVVCVSVVVVRGILCERYLRSGWGNKWVPFPMNFRNQRFCVHDISSTDAPNELKLGYILSPNVEQIWWSGGPTKLT